MAWLGDMVFLVGFTDHMRLMDHPPNEMAVSFLSREVMPVVWALRPEARLVQAGDIVLGVGRGGAA